MFSFADDSGDLGQPTRPGASTHFVLALIVVQNSADVDQIVDAIKAFKKVAKLPDDIEIKFYDLKSPLRIKFLKAIRKLPFRVKAMVIDKRKFTQLSTHQHVHIKELLQKHAAGFHKISLKIDGALPRKRERVARSELRQVNRNTPQAIGKIRFVNSANNSLVQLADMIAGSIFRSTQPQKKDQYTYIKLIEDKIDDIYYKTN